MSFVSFPANYAGSAPGPFAPFAAGEIVFYLVGTINGASPLPAPGAQLSVFKDTTKGSGRNPVDTVTETAKGWRGRRRITVATRTYSWPRYTRGALAAARESAQWTDPQGAPLAVWSNLVSVDDADALGYRTPLGHLNAARPGRRGVGVENNARGTIRGRSVAVAQGSNPAPVAPALTPGLAPAIPQGLASLVQDAAQSVDAVRDAARPLPGWARSMARNPVNVQARAEAQAAREAQAAQNADRREAQAQAERFAAQAGRMAYAGAERFASLDLGSAPASVESGPCVGAERFASLDLG